MGSFVRNKKDAWISLVLINPINLVDNRDLKSEKAQISMHLQIGTLKTCAYLLSSPIRTLTVGSGFTPDQSKLQAAGVAGFVY